MNYIFDSSILKGPPSKPTSIWKDLGGSFMSSSGLNNINDKLGTQSFKGGKFWNSLGGLVGSATGNLAGGAIGSIISGVTSLFQGTPAHVFTQHWKRYEEEIFPREAQSNNYSSFSEKLTKLDYGNSFMIAFYDDHVSGSNSERSKKGNGDGLRGAQQHREALRQSTSNDVQKNGGNMNYSDQRHKFPNEYYPGMTSSGDLTGDFRAYDVEFPEGKEPSPARPVSAPKSNDGGDPSPSIGSYRFKLWHLLLILPAIGGGAYFLIKKFKK
jgi:hypothetical protein